MVHLVKLLLLMLFAVSTQASMFAVPRDSSGNLVNMDPDSSAMQVKEMYQTRYLIGPNGDTTDVTVVGDNVSLNVDIQDRETPLVDLHFYTNGATTFFASTVTVNTVTGLLPKAHGISAGDYVRISEGEEFYDADVQAIGVGPSFDTLHVDTPFDFAFTASAVIAPGSSNLAQDGSAAALTAFVSPQHNSDGFSFHITRIMISITDATAMDDGIFGGDVALTNGIVVRTLIDGVLHNLFNAKTNGDLAAHAYDLTYASKPPAGSGHGLRWRRTFGGQSKGGSVIALSSTTNDQIQIIIRDDLTGLVTFTAVAQGHVEE